MIIVKLMGGLGNQMFQYAAARSLAWRHGTSLKFDLSFLEGDQPGDTRRSFELDKFCISTEIASRREIFLMRGRGSSFLSSLSAKILQKCFGYTDYREKGFRFDPHLLELPDNCYLEGFWQSEHYFEGIRKIICKELTVTSPLTAINRDLAEKIAKVNAVSLHIRRGDYVKDEKTRTMHGVCGLEYYSRAEERVAEKLKEPNFFVFSDDPDWVEKNLRLRHPTRYISHNGSMPHEDLRLMSLCKHHIIANSSFSWWGAWLSANPDKLVIAPNRWFNDLSIDATDLIPLGWQRL